MGGRTDNVRRFAEISCHTFLQVNIPVLYIVKIQAVCHKHSMLPKPCISGGIRCVQNGFRIQIVSAVKQHKLPLFLPEIVGQRSVCDHVAGECKCLAVFFAVRAHQSNILRQSCAVGKIAVQKSLEQGMLLLSQGDNDLVFSKIPQKMHKQFQYPGRNFFSTAGFQKNLLRIRSKASGIGKAIKLRGSFFPVDHLSRLIAGRCFVRKLVILYPGFLLLYGHSVAGFYERDHFLSGTIKTEQSPNMWRK